VGRGSYILKNPAVSIVGGIQPGKLQPYIKAAVFGGNSDDGLSQRFQMLVWPDVPKQWKNVDRRPDFDAQMAVDVVFKRLHNIDPIAIGATIDQFGERPAYLHFTTEAQALFDQFRMKLEVSLRNDAKHPALESHLAKYRSLVPALALVIHLADDGTGPVTKVALEKAIGWSNYLWSHARRVYACVTHSAGFAARALADRIQSGKLESGFTARAVARNSWQHLSDAEDVRAAIEWLTDADWLRPQEKPTTEKGGRSTVTYQVNPKVMNK
jgi:putative DNA primase/helicase